MNALLIERSVKLLTKVFVNVWMLFKKNAINLELDLLNFSSLLVVIHSHSKLVVVVREIVRNLECLSKASGVPTHLWLAIDVESDHATP